TGSQPAGGSAVIFWRTLVFPIRRSASSRTLLPARTRQRSAMNGSRPKISLIGNCAPGAAFMPVSKRQLWGCTTIPLYIEPFVCQGLQESVAFPPWPSAACLGGAQDVSIRLRLSLKGRTGIVSAGSPGVGEKQVAVAPEQLARLAPWAVAGPGWHPNAP